MKRQVMRVAAGANLVAGCLLLQGCGMFDKRQDPAVTTLPGGEQTPVEVQPLEPIEPIQPIQTMPVELPVVQMTTPYTIQKGDTLSSIAYKYNLRWQDIMAINPGLTPKRLRIGQMVQLPGQINVTHVRSVPVATSKVSAPKTVAPKASPTYTASEKDTTYVVKSGDSLSVIAYRHGIKTASLRAANNIKGDKIVVGQKLKVPGATKSPSAKATPKASVSSAPKVVAPKAAAEASAPKTVTPPPPAVPEAPPAAVESAAVKVETTPAPAAPVVDANTQTYTVKEGEDLYAVAIRWGVSPSDLKALNNLTSSEIKAGTVLKIPQGQ